MPFKASFFSFAIASCVVLTSSNVLAVDDYCTPKLNTYLKNVQKTVDSKYVSQRQKEVAQKILDKVKGSRNETKDCVLIDKLLP
ncbi:hypothetical protein [Marinomonas transparens]|uniref:Uncharacterized protein n=1 Tax=Marinomonas transparens TaxID=2795388 RepID=A0A934JNH3_9GAMM|nr:hypothetical protein [Marinomonas transparens]MBJ7539041.1 hypothetical protein [Marinomonas transparens]